MSTFSLLASGCRFDTSKARAERQQFGSHETSSLPSSQIGGGIGGLDFFGAPAGSSAADSATDAAAATASGAAAKRKRKKQSVNEDAANGGGDGEAEDATPAEDLTLSRMSEREIADANALRRAMRIHVYGTTVPAPVQSAEHMADRYLLKPWLRRNILESGYHELTRVQMQAVPLLLGGREVLACAPTGSGKTAAFLVPMLARLGGPRRQGLRAVCIAPTQELARQTHRELLKLSAGSGIEACVLTKKLASAASSQAEHGVQPVAAGKKAAGKKAAGSVWRKYDAMVCTPLRLVSLLKKKVLSLDGVQV